MKTPRKYRNRRVRKNPILVVHSSTHPKKEKKKKETASFGFQLLPWASVRLFINPDWHRSSEGINKKTKLISFQKKPDTTGWA